MPPVGPVTDPVSGSELCSQDFAANADATATAYYALELLQNCDLFGILYCKATFILFPFSFGRVRTKPMFGLKVY